jgi:structural maintenance of chromosome 2
VAMPLILAMLLFKPAPIYFLDEVDNALDLSYTKNVRVILKQHFKQSQFILHRLRL